MTVEPKKVCMLGDSGVGKTSLVRRFLYGMFDGRYINTVGVRVSRKSVTVPSPDHLVNLTMMLWDLTSREQFSIAQLSYLRGAAGVVLVCDLIRPETLDNVRAYADGLFSVSPETKLMLAVNKSDLANGHPPSVSARLTPVQIEAVTAEINTPYYLTSAKTGAGVDTLFRHLGRLLVA